MKNSILQKLLFAMLAFGISMGAIFPVFAGFFVEWKEGMFGWFVASCLAAGVSLGFISFFLVNTILIKKLEQLSSIMNAIAKGDLTSRCNVQSEDVLGEIIKSVETMADSLRRIIGNIHETTMQATKTTSNLSGICETTSSRFDEQSVQTDRVVRLVESMSDSADAAASHTSEAAQLAQDAQNAAQNGSSVATNAIRAMDTLVSEMDSLGTVVGSLAGYAQNIDAVLSVISGIAQQTNLLALNAAIEAARAGEQGRGFAVVADEVRNLANRSHASTTEIHDIMQHIQQGTDNVVSAVDRAKQSLEDSKQQVSNTHQRLQEINQQVSKILGLNQDIAQTASSQTSNAGEVKRGVHMISQIAVETSHAAGQMNSSFGQLIAIMKQLDGEFSRFKMR